MGNTESTYGYEINPLLNASRKGDTETVKLLLERVDIDINVTNASGETALIIASKEGNTEIVELLLKQKKIDINAKEGNYGYTALMIASQYGQPEIVKLLLKREDIEINAKNEDGETALMIASVYNLMFALPKNNTEIVKLLLEHKDIDIDVADKQGRTALMIASKFGIPESAKLLENAVIVREQQEYLYIIEKILYNNRLEEGKIEEGNIFEIVFDFLIKK